MTPSNAVEVTGLGRTYGHFSAVRGVSFTIPQGEILGLLGPNGAGKTTTIRMLCGILLPSSGQARVLGYDVARQPEQVKKRIGYMSQRFSLYNDLTAYENLAFYARIYGVPERQLRARLAELIALSGLRGHERDLTRSLSGAWRQRLALACAIAHEPPMLFLDEPTAGVDPVSRREFWDLIYALAGRGVSVLATTHYMDEAEYCNTIAMMYQGQIIALDSPEALKRQLRGQLLELDCDQPGRATEVASRLPEVLDVTLHGVLLHLTVADAAQEQLVRRQLDTAGVQVRRLDPILPSLEDAFLALVEVQDRQRIQHGLTQGEEP